MINAFLRAEFHSPRFKSAVRGLLGGRTNLVYQPSTSDDDENEARKAVLATYRGYGVDTLLFKGFPPDVSWVRATCTVSELGAMKYANYPTWITLSGGSRLVRDGAANVESVATAERINQTVIEVGRALERGQTHAELILVAESEDEVPVLVEGHTRATAYMDVVIDNDLRPARSSTDSGTFQCMPLTSER